jgi:hypothetical protein
LGSLPFSFLIVLDAQVGAGLEEFLRATLAAVGIDEPV